MQELIDAILRHQLESVRSIAKRQRDLASVRSLAGDLPLDIAECTGNVATYVSLLRLGAPSDRTKTLDYCQIQIDYIAQLSDSYAQAGWLSDIEFIVYAIMMGDKLPCEDPHGFVNLDGETLDDLRFLVDRSGSWPSWTIADDDVRSIPIAEWEPIYKAWLSRRRDMKTG